MNDISFSIVVATKGRVQLLRDLMESAVAAKRNYGGACEVLIIDDSAPAESVEIQQACFAFDCKYVYHKNTVAAKRNYGVTQAENDIILFLDSDSIATEHILEAYAQRYVDEHVAAVAGPLRFVGPDTWFWKAIEATPFLVCFSLPESVPKLEWGVTANFSVRRDVFLEVGGFSEAFRRPAGEDVDLGLMIRETGYDILGAPDALVYHSKKTWMPFKDMVRRLFFYGTADCDLINKHPGRGETLLPKRVCLYAIYALVILLLAIVARSWVLLAGIPAVILLENLAMSLLINRFSGRKRVSLVQQLMAQFLIHVSEAAYVLRCIATGKPRKIKEQMVYYAGQYEGMLKFGLYQTLVGLGCLGGILIFLFIFWRTCL